MTARLYIARHGDTFAPGETPRRIGARTDLPLVESGREQARRLGARFAAEGAAFDAVFCSPLRRASESADIILAAMKSRVAPQVLSFLTEIDYGEDENRTEEAVRARIGADALRRWEEEDAPPPGWRVDPQALTRSWRDFFAGQARAGPRAALIVTSAGVARFALRAARECGADTGGVAGKLATGAFGRLDVAAEEGGLRLAVGFVGWNLRP